jgi:hypothetical protein
LGPHYQDKRLQFEKPLLLGVLKIEGERQASSLSVFPQKQWRSLWIVIQRVIA